MSVSGSPTPDREPVPIDELLAHADWLRTLARSLAADAQTADDLVQDTWVAALRHPPRGGGAPRNWLSKVLRNFARQRSRSEGFRSDLEAQQRPADSSCASALQLAERAEFQRLLAESVLALAEPYRSTVLQRYYDGQSSAEIGRRRRLGSSTVRSQLKRALEQLREDLGAEPPRDGAAWSLFGPLKFATAALLGILLVIGLASIVGPDREAAREITRASTRPAGELSDLDSTLGSSASLSEGARRSLSGAEPASELASTLDDGTSAVRRVELTVVDAAGRAVSGADVTLVDYGRPTTDLPHERRSRGITASDGRLLIELSARDLGTPQGLPAMTERASIGVLARGHAASELHHLRCEPGETVRLEIAVGGTGVTLSGAVLDADGRPIENARITAGDDISRPLEVGRGNFRTSQSVSAHSGPDGRFELPHVAHGRTQIRTTADGFVPSVRWEEVPERELHAFDLRMQRGGSICGIVRDAEGRPVPGARVWFHSLQGVVAREVRSDESGFYFFNGLKPTERSFWAQAGERVASSVQRLRSDEELYWDPTLEPAVGVRLRLIDESGDPLGAWVLIASAEGGLPWERHLASDADGRALWYDTPEVPIRVHVFAPDTPGFPVVTLSSLVPSSEERVVTVAARDRLWGTLSGVLLDADSERFERASLVIEDMETNAVVEIELDPATGSFREELPAGRYRIDAHPASLGSLPLGTHTITAGELKDLGLLRAPRPGLIRVDGYWPDDGTEDVYAFMLAAVEKRGGGWSALAIDQGSKRPRAEYEALPGYYTLVVERNGEILQRHGVFVDSSRELGFETGPDTQPMIPLRFELPAGNTTATRLDLRVTRLEGTEGTEPEEHEWLLSAGGVFQGFLPLTDGPYLLEGRTDSGLTGSRRVQVQTAWARCQDIQLD